MAKLRYPVRTQKTGTQPWREGNNTPGRCDSPSHAVVKTTWVPVSFEKHALPGAPNPRDHRGISNSEEPVFGGLESDTVLPNDSVEGDRELVRLRSRVEYDADSLNAMSITNIVHPELNPAARPFISVTHRVNIGGHITNMFDGVQLGSGLIDALSMRVSGPPFVVGFRGSAETINGCKLSFNVQKRPTNGWVNCSARADGRSVPTKGVWTVWRREGVTMIAYSDGAAVLQFLESLWALDPATRNRLMHALNGNIEDWFDIPIDGHSVPDTDTASIASSIHEDVPVSNYYKVLMEHDQERVLVAVFSAIEGIGDYARFMEHNAPEGPLTSGNKIMVRGLLTVDKGKRRSASNKAHSDKRTRSLVEAAARLPPERVEIWCKLHRPRIQDVPDVDNEFVKRYRDGARRDRPVQEAIADAFHNYFHFIRKCSAELQTAHANMLSRLPGVEEAEDYARRQLNGANGEHTGLDDVTLMRQNMTFIDACDAAITNIMHITGQGMFHLEGEIARGVLNRNDLAQMPSHALLAAHGWGDPILCEATAADPIDDNTVFITMGYLNHSRDTDRVYEHQYVNGGWEVEAVDEHGGVGRVNRFLEPSRVISRVSPGGFRARLWFKLTTRDPTTGYVRPDWPVVYVFRWTARGEAPSPPWNKRIIHHNDSGRIYNAVIGPHNCGLHDSSTDETHVISKATYNDISRNYHSGQSLVVVRRNTNAMYRQGRDAELTAPALTAYCDFMAARVVQAMLETAESHSNTRSSLITDALSGNLRWRWYGLWDPYARNARWWMARETQPYPWIVRLWGQASVVALGYVAITRTTGAATAAVTATGDAAFCTYDGLLRSAQQAGRVASAVVRSFSMAIERGIAEGTRDAALLNREAIEARASELASGRADVSVFVSPTLANAIADSLGEQSEIILFPPPPPPPSVPLADASVPPSVTPWPYYAQPDPADVEALTTESAKLATDRCPTALVSIASVIEHRLRPPWALIAACAAIGFLGTAAIIRSKRAERGGWWTDYWSAPMGRWSEFWKRLPIPMHPTARLIKWSRYSNVDGNVVHQALPAVGNTHFASHARGPQSALHSFTMRVARPTPDPTPEMIREYEAAFDALSDGFCGIPVMPTEWQEFVSRFPPGKRACYEEAKELFDTWGVSLWHGRRNRLLNRNSFLKHELNLQLQPGLNGASAKDPRTIMTLHTTIQATLGPFFHAYGKRLLDVCNAGYEMRPGCRVRFAFGMTKNQLWRLVAEEWTECETYIVVCGDDAFFRHRGVIYFVDGTRWDAHMKRHMLLPKIRHYRQVGLHPFFCDLLTKLMERRVVYGTGMQQVVGEVDATVSSGDPDTLPGNCAKMACALTAMTTQEDIFEAGLRLGLVFEVAAEQRVFNDPFGDFCSAIPCTPTLISKPGKVMAKLPWIANPGFPPHLVAAAKLQACIYDLRFFPEICTELTRLRQIYEWASIPQHVLDAINGKYRMLPEGDEIVEVDPEVFFAERYNADYQELIWETRRYVDTALRGGWECDMPAWATVCCVDLGKDIDIDDLQFESALAKRLNRDQPDNVRPQPRRRRLRKLWNRLMHALNGNRSGFVLNAVLVLLLFLQIHVEGGRGGANLLRFHQHQLQNNSIAFISMPDKTKQQPKKGKTAPRARAPPPKKNTGGDASRSMVALAKQMGSLANGLNAKLKRVKTTGPFEMAGRFLGSITGTGDYILNDIVHQRGTAGKLKRGVSSNVISNCEYVRDIVSTGSSSFLQTVSPIHPTEGTLFPWLVNVSKLYTKYRFKQLVFEFRSMSSEYSSAIGLGTIVMAPQYNIDAPLFQTKQQMEAATHAVSFKPSNSAMMGVECAAVDNNVKWYNVRNRDEIPITNFTDPGRFCLALSGIPTTVLSGTTLGELWVHYTIELIEPILALPVNEIGVKPLIMQYYNNDTGVGNIMTRALGLTGGTAGTEGSGPNDSTPQQWLHAPSVDYMTSHTDWLMAWVNNGASLYFSTPGTYYLSWFAKFNIAPTSVPGSNPFTWTPVNVNDLVVTSDNEQAAATVARWSSVANGMVFNIRWKIVVKRATLAAPAELAWDAPGVGGGTAATLYASDFTCVAYVGY